MKLTDKNAAELRECLELLNASLVIEYHNKNWLCTALINNPGEHNREQRNLIERALRIVGTTAGQPFP